MQLDLLEKCNDCQFLWSRGKSAVLCIFIMSNTTEHSYNANNK